MRKKSDKIQIPNIDNEYLKRKADFRLDSCQESVIVLNAGAGYGKTQILAYYVRHCKEKSAWYSLSKTDNELMSFVQNFTKSVGNVLELEENFHISVSLQEDLDILVENLVVWLDKKIEKLNIILDDFQEIHNPDIFNLLNVLIETMSEKLRFFIVEMRSLHHFLEEYITNGTAICIETEDLKFGQPEIEMLLEHSIHTEFQKQAAELIYFYTEGWPVGVIQIIQQMLRQRKKFSIDILKEICEKLEVSDYLMKRVYKMLPFDIQTFLEKTSVLDYMTVSACNYILGNYQSESLLKYLVKEKLFVQSLGENSGIYRYHSIFQRFLLSRISKVEQKATLKKAAYFFLKTEDKIQAAEYGCRGDAVEVVQAVIEVAGEEILEEKLYDTLRRWFEFLYRKNCKLTPKSQFIYGKYLWRAGYMDKAREQILEAGKAFYQEGRKKDYQRVLLFAAISERKAGNLKQSEDYLQEVQKISENDWDDLAETIYIEHIKQKCCLQQIKEIRNILEDCKEHGGIFQEGSFLFAAAQVFFNNPIEYLETEQGFCDNEIGQKKFINWKSDLYSEILFREIEDGFLLQNCILMEELMIAYNVADFQSVKKLAQQILQNAEYETLHTAIAWKMLAILSWNKKNYRKAMEQAEIGNQFLYRNQIQLQDFAKRHQDILEEIDSLHKNVKDIPPLLSKNKHVTVFEPENNTKIYIQCMKHFCVTLPNGEEVKWRTKKAQELFAYLFHLQGEGVAREELITLLWPETGIKSATALFHTTLYSIRQIFIQEEGENLIIYEKKKYSLNMHMIFSDLEKLQLYFQKFKRKQEDPELVLQLYLGGYMENMGYLWSYGTAKELENDYLFVCKTGAIEQIHKQQEALAIPFLQRMQEVEPYDEEIVKLLIVCLYRSGKKREAKQQYNRMVKLYKEDLELDFKKTFQELVEK